MVERYCDSNMDLPDGMETDLPIWSERALIHVLGVDLSDNPSIVLLDSAQRELELPEDWFDDAIIETRETYRSELPTDGAYLLHAELESLGVRYDIETNKPFDPSLLQVVVHDVDGVNRAGFAGGSNS